MHIRKHKKDISEPLVEPAKPAGLNDGLTDNPKKGVVCYLIHTVLMSINLYAGKAMFDLNPTVGIMQLTFSRGFMATILLVAVLNTDLKATLVDGVDRSSVGSLVLRCLQGGLSVFISFMCIKYFNVSTVGIVCSLTPLIVVVMAYFMLGEQMKLKSMIALLFIFLAVILVILGAEGEQRETMSANFWVTLALMSQPLLLAGGAIATRSMRKMKETVVSTYQNISLMLLAAIVMYANGEEFSFLLGLSWVSWGLLIANGALTVLA